MNGRRAKIIRKTAALIHKELVKQYPKLTFRRLYRDLKRKYTLGLIN